MGYCLIFGRLRRRQAEFYSVEALGPFPPLQAGVTVRNFGLFGRGEPMGADGGFDENESTRALRRRLEDLREEHRALDAAIYSLHITGGDLMQLARLKKRKLALKDEITWIENQLTPDIIA